MEEKEFLLTIAQVALGIAGFSGVVTAFMKRPGKLSTVEIYRVSVLVSISFGLMFLALLPLTFEQLGLAGGRAWRNASAVMAGASIIGVTIFLVSSRHISRLAPEIFNRYLMATMAAGHVLNVMLQIVNAASPSDASPGIYAIGLLWYLFHAAVQFSRMLFVQPADR